MSRIGKLPISIPKGVQVTVGKDNVATVKGPLGEIAAMVHPDIKIKVDDGHITVTRSADEKRQRALHGLWRATLANHIEGVSIGHRKELELVGVGFKAAQRGQLLDLILGYSHNIVFEIPKEVKLETKTEKGKNPIITLKSYNKQLLGQVAAKIRALRKPDPYKGKGIRYLGEILRKKAGKAAVKQ